MPRHRASLKAEQDELRERMRTLGLGYCEIAGEFARRYRLRPRAAWRVAYGWTLKQAADHINAHAADAGLDSGGTASMTGPHLCEYEQWPGLGTVPTGRKPTPYILALLAAVYGADSYQLLDLDDYAHLPAADRLVLDKHTRTPAQQHALPVGDPGGGRARISGSAAAFRTSQGATATPRASRGPEPPATSGAITYGHLPGLRPLGPDVTPAYGDGKTWTGLPGRSDPAGGSAHGALTVTMDDIGVIRNMLAALTTSDRQFGGGHARAYAADYLHAVVWPRLHAPCDDSVRHDLIVVATEFMLRVASLDLDGGHAQASRTLLGIASGLAHESSDLALNAWVLARWGEQKIHEKDLGQALAYTRAAAELARQAPPAARAFILTKYALALSMTGERTATLHSLDEARNAYGKSGDGSEPDWMGNYGWGHVRHEEGRCYCNLGMGSEAVQAEEESMQVRSREQFARPRAFSLGILAMGHAQAGQIEQACDISHDLVTLTMQLTSSRVQIRLSEVLEALDDHKSLPAVRGVHEAAQPALARSPL
jgi:hypothetical protein